MMPGAVPAVDPGNGLLSEVPAQLTTALVDTPHGQRLAMTVRTTSATLTVFLSGTDAKLWAQQLTKEAALVPGAGLAVVPGTMIPAAPNGGRAN